MVLSIRSQNFQDTYKKFSEELEKGNLQSKEEQQAFFGARDIGSEEFKKAAFEYEDALATGETDFEARGTFLARVPGRAVGDLARGAVDLVDLITPGDLSNSIATAMDNAPIPDSAKEVINELFDPYHGEGVGASIEKGAAFLGSLIVPSSSIIKGLNLSNKGVNLAGPAARATIKEAAKKIDKSKRREFLLKEYEKASRIPQLAQTAGQGAVYAGVATAVENPEEGIANILVDSFPEARQYLDRLYVNPDDTEAENFLKRLMGNLGFSAALSPLYLAYAYKQPITQGAAIAFQPIGKAMGTVAKATGLNKISLPANFSSRMGTDDTTIALTLEKENAVDAALKTATQSAKEYDRLLDETARAQAATTGTNFIDIKSSLKNKVDTLMGNIDEVKALEYDSFNKKYGEDLINKYQTEMLDTAKQADPELGFVLRQRVITPDGKKGTIVAIEDGAAVVNIPRPNNKPIKKTFKIDDLELNVNDKKQKQIKEMAVKRAEADARKFANNKTREYLNTNISELPKELQEQVRTMRKDIDKASSIFQRDAQGKLKAAVGNNNGIYITKSYSLFDDPIYKNQIQKKYKKFKEDGTDEKGVFSDALETIKKSLPKEATYEDAKITLDRLLKSDTSMSVGDIFESVLTQGKKITSAKSGQARKEIPDSIRAILKPVEGFDKNYITTMSNLSRINATNKYLKELSEHMLESGVAKKVTLGDPTDLEKAASSSISRVLGKGPTEETVANPFTQVYTDNENYIRLVNEGLNVVDPVKSPLMKAFLGAKGFSQSVKTIFSPVTWGRNIMGNGFFIVANGMFTPKGLGDSFKITKANFLNKSSKEQAEKYAKYVKYGLVNSGLNVNQLRRNMSEAVKDTDGWIAKGYEKVTQNGVNQKFVDFYQAQDDVFKITHFENTLKQLKNSPKYAGKPIEEIERAAAQRTRDLMPNYKLVPKAIKNLGGTVFGDFVSFPAEVIRVSKNLAKYTYDDLLSGDPALQQMAAKRLAGMTVVGMGGDMVSDLSRNMAGITDEQEAAINTIVQPWEYNQDRIYLSGIYEDRNNHKGVDYLNLGPIDPFAYLKSMSRGVHSALLEGLDQNEANERLDEIAFKTLNSSLGPFLAPSMITDTLMTSYNKIKQDGLSYEAVGDPLIELFTPGAWNQIVKYNQYTSSKEKQDLVNQDPYKKGYSTFYSGEVDVPAAFGLRRQRADITASIPFAIEPNIADIRGLPGKMTNKISDPSITDPEEVYNVFYDSQKSKIKSMEKIRNLMKTYKTLLGDNYLNDVGYGLSRMGSKPIDSTTREIVGQADNNVYSPFVYNLTPAIMQLSRTPIPVDKMNELVQKYNGTVLEEEEDELQ